MRIIVISLTSATERRHAAAKQLQQLDLDFEFLDAITGSNALSGNYFKDFRQDEFLLNTGRLITYAEVGCFASHREVWKQCVELNESVLIMEDDFSLADDFVDALQVAERCVDHYGFLRLQPDENGRKRNVETINGFAVSRFTKAPMALLCYCISPPAARKFVAATDIFDASVDIFVKKFWKHGQPLYALTPYTVHVSALSEDTSLVGRIKARKPLSVAMHRFGRKLIEHVRRMTYNSRFQVTRRTEVGVTPAHGSTGIRRSLP